MDVHQNIKDEKYVNKLPHPQRPVQDAILKQQASKLTDDEIKRLPEAKKTFDRLTKQYNDDLQAWREETNRLNQKFRADLEEEFGTAGHPKADKLWDQAWEQGHGNGLNEVWVWYDQFSELLDLNNYQGLWEKLTKIAVGCSMHTRKNGKKGCFVTVDMPKQKAASTLESKTFNGVTFLLACRQALAWANGHKSRK